MNQSLALAITGLLAPWFGGREPFAGDWESLVSHPDGLLPRILSNWQRWDALWYQHIAMSGYSATDGSIAFYPLFPLLSAAVSHLSGDLVLAELIVAAVADVGAMWMLWRLVHLEIASRPGHGDRAMFPGHERGALVPLLTVLLTAVFPTGFFLLAPYTESLFLFFTVASFWSMRSGRLWTAGMFGLLASLTRVQGIFLALPIGYEAARQSGLIHWLRTRGQGRIDRATLASGLALLLPALGMLAFTAYQVVFLGARQVGLGSQALWGLSLVPPWVAFSSSFGYVARNLGKPSALVEILNGLTLVGATAIALAGARRIPPAYSLYVIPSLGLLYFRVMFFSPLMSASRYVLVVFPCFMIAASWFAFRPRLALGWLAVSGALQLALFQYWVRWGFVA